jgi:hypothetical protein
MYIGGTGVRPGQMTGDTYWWKAILVCWLPAPVVALVLALSSWGTACCGIVEETPKLRGREDPRLRHNP